MSEIVTTFIYQPTNPTINELAKIQGHLDYINSFNAHREIPVWRDKFEKRCLIMEALPLLLHS